MTALHSQVSFETFATDDDLDLDRLTTDLDSDLSEIGEVSRLVRDQAPGDKGAGEVVLATLNVLTSVDPVQIEAMIRVLAGFAKRNEQRRVYVRIGGDEIRLDNGSEEQVDDLVAAFLSAAKRHKH